MSEIAPPEARRVCASTPSSRGRWARARARGCWRGRCAWTARAAGKGPSCVGARASRSTSRPPAAEPPAAPPERPIRRVERRAPAGRRQAGGPRGAPGAGPQRGHARAAAGRRGGRRGDPRAGSCTAWTATPPACSWSRAARRRIGRCGRRCAPGGSSASTSRSPEGRPPARSGTIDAPLGRDRRRRTRDVDRHDAPCGRDPLRGRARCRPPRLCGCGWRRGGRTRSGRTCWPSATRSPATPSTARGAFGLERQFLHARGWPSRIRDGEWTEIRSPLPADPSARSSRPNWIPRERLGGVARPMATPTRRAGSCTWNGGGPAHRTPAYTEVGEGGRDVRLHPFKRSKRRNLRTDPSPALTRRRN